MDQALQELRQYIDTFRTWIEQHAEPLCRDEHAEIVRLWKEDLSAAESLLDHKPELPIAMLGPSQQGKSTLINALLGVNVLAVGGAVGACTCVITSVHHAEIEGFRAEIQFIKLDEWRQELRQLRELFDQIQSDEDTNADRVEIQNQIETATEKLKAVYGIEEIEDFDFSLADSETCGLAAEILPYMENGSQPLQIEQMTAQSMRNNVRLYMVGRNQHNSDRQYWPVISEIRIYGNFQVLANGLVLVDLPGLDDPNPAREQVTRRYLEQARYLWMVCNSQTGITRVFTTMLREEKLLLRLYLEGRLPEFSVIATRADSFDLAAVIQQMGLDPNTGNFDLNEVVQFRNFEVTKAVREQLIGVAKGITLKTGDVEQGQRFLAQIERIPIFVVASASYLNAIGLNPLFHGLKIEITETNIPKLMEHLQKITLERSFQHRVAATSQKLGHLYRESQSFFLERTRDFEALDQRVREQWLRLQAQARSAVEDKKASIQRHTDSAQTSLNHRCNDFAREIERLDKQVINSFHEVFTEWQQLNWRTLQAIVKNRGVWYSKSLGRRFNLNDDIASAFLELISLKWDQFFGEHLKQVIEELAREYLREVDTLVQRIDGQISMLDRTPEGLTEVLSGNVKVVKDSYDLRSQQTTAALQHHIQTARRELTTGVFELVEAFMEPAYQKAKSVQTGTGIKQRMLEILERQVHVEAQKLLINIQKELKDGVAVLQGAIRQKFDSLGEYAAQQVAQIESNLQSSPTATTAEKECYQSALSQMPMRLCAALLPNDTTGH